MLLKMKQILVSILVYLTSYAMRRCDCNPINAYPPHLINHPTNFMNMHPALVPLYSPMQSMQYQPAFPMQPQLAASSLEEQYQQANVQQPLISNLNSESTGAISPHQTSNQPKDNASKNDDEDDDANKRDDEDTFWEVASSYGKNRWTNFKDGFTELLDVFRAAGRGFKGIFTTSE